MAKIKDPIQFSDNFGVPKTRLSELGVFDPSLNVDTKLFIDPLLLAKSQHVEMRESGDTYKTFFSEIINLLGASKEEGDIAWRTAYKRLLFREIKGTCLGYGASSISGRAVGPFLARKITRTAKEIIELGVTDPDLFIALPLLEENVGPDLISDMTTNIILPDLFRFNERILGLLEVPRERFNLKGFEASLVANPREISRTPIILTPMDVLRELPTANDWEEVCQVASENAVLRDKVNKLIGEIWRAKTRKDKDKIRRNALASYDSFTTLLDTIHGIDPRSYDYDNDPDGLLIWRRIHNTIAKDFPLEIRTPKSLTLSDVYKVVVQIVDQFQHLIEKRGLSRELWHKGDRRNEKSVQRLFFAVADSYCKANNLDISPESDTGTGQVDFKFSQGYENRVLVEIKLSDNRKLVSGYEKQLDAYKESERSLMAMYLIVDVGKLGKKLDKITQLKNAQALKRLSVSEIVLIDGSIKNSASKL